MTELRKRMLENMDLCGYAEKTKESYAGVVKNLAEHYSMSPADLTDEDIRKFFLHLINERGVQPSTVRSYLAGIKFLYEKTLQRKLPFLELACPKKVKKLPVVFTLLLTALIEPFPDRLNRATP